MRIPIITIGVLTLTGQALGQVSNIKEFKLGTKTIALADLLGSSQRTGSRAGSPMDNNHSNDNRDNDKRTVQRSVKPTQVSYTYDETKGPSTTILTVNSAGEPMTVEVQLPGA